MKKVLFTATVDSHILQFHLPFLKLFKEKGYEVHVATNGNEEIPYCDVKHVVSFERSPFKLNNLKAIKQLRKIIKDEKFDVIHTHTPMGSVVTRLAAKKYRKKYHTRVIYTAHGLHFFKGASLKNWLLFYPVEKYLSKFTDTLILINQEDYDLCKRKFKKCKDIQYVPGVGIDEEKFDFKMTKKEKVELRKSLGLKENDFVMIYPAELNKNKNQIMLINAMVDLTKKYDNIKLLLPGKDSYNGYYQKIVRDNKLDEYIKFLGFRKDIPQLLKISDLAVATSQREGLPVNIMEAMYVGLPIVATNCRGQRDLVKDHINGYLVNLSDQDRFNNCIEKVYLSNDKNNKFGEESKYVIREYLLNKIILKMEIIYFKKKIILHLLSSNKYSGAENVACTIIDNLKDEYEMFYCCPSGPIEEMLSEKNINYLKISKINIIELKRILNKIKPNVIHAHDFTASTICSLVKGKFLLIEHLHNNCPWLQKICINSIAFLYAGLRADKILTVSDSIEKEYIFSKYIKNKIECIGNPVSRNKILSYVSEQDFKKKYDVCCVARLTEQKNPQRFINIIESLKNKIPNIKTIWVGSGELEEECKKLIAEKNLEDNIKFVGFKKNPYKYMASSRVFLLTSDWEGFGLVAFEALTLGLPCVVSNVGGLPNIVDNKCGFLCNDNCDYIDGVFSLLCDNSKYKVYSEKSKDKAMTLDNLNKYISSISSFYEE